MRLIADGTQGGGVFYYMKRPGLGLLWYAPVVGVCSLSVWLAQLKLKVKDEHFFKRLKWLLHFQGARANRMGTTCGSLRLRLHKPHVAIVRPRALTSQSSVAVTHYILIATHFTYPGGLESWVEIVCSGDWTRTSCTHEWTCAGAANDLTNWASQTDCWLSRWPLRGMFTHVCRRSGFNPQSRQSRLRIPALWGR